MIVSRIALATAVLSWANVAAAHAETKPVPAAAEPAEPAVENNPADIIVTAQKRSESINRVPLSITAATGDQLRAIGITQTADLAKIVSGFQAVQTQSGTPVFYLRGVGFKDISVGARPTVTLYNDEAPLPYSVMAMGTTLDLERVEVLKGPQGLLFGSNSTGGAINFIAAKPTDTFKAGYDLSLGSYLSNRESGFMSGPLSDSVKVRVAVEHDGMDNWQYDYTNPSRTIGHRSIYNGRFILEAQPTSHLRVTFTQNGSIDISDPQQPQFVAADPAVAISVPLLNAPAPPRNDRATGFNDTGPVGVKLKKDNWQYQSILRADYTISDKATITSLTSYAENQQKYAMDGDGTDLNIVSFGIFGRIKAFSQELRLTGSVGDKLNYIVGGNIEDDRTRETQVYNIAGQRNGATFSGPPFFFPLADNNPATASTHFKSQAGFANLDYNLSDLITLHGGVRYTATQTHFNGCTTNGVGTPGALSIGTGLALALGFPPVGPGQCFTVSLTAAGPRPLPVVRDLNEHNVSWRGGIDIKPTSTTLIYGSVSRGYKAGSFSDIGATFAAQYEPVPQESVTAYEAGIKTDLVPSILHVNSAVFYYDYLNKQVQGTVNDPVFGPIQRLVSIPKSRIYGAELEATLRPISGLTLSATSTYVKTKVLSSFAGTTEFGLIKEFKGSPFPNTPEFQAGANAEYRVPVGANEVYVGGNMTYRSKTYGDFLKEERLAIMPYTIFDARIGFENKRGGYTIEAFGRNIFNTFYYTAQERPGDAIFRFTGMPAIYGARFSYRFH